MIVHILRFSFKDATTDEQKAEVLATMDRTASVESVTFKTIGQDLGDPAEGFTHAYCVGIEDLDALERYMHEPVHNAGDFVIIPHLARLAAVDLSDDMDPELSQKVVAMHLRKIEMYPDWAELLATIPDMGIATEA